MKRPQLTKKAFKEWLEGHEPNETAGQLKVGGSCPIASFCNKQVDDDVFFVGYQELLLWPKGQDIKKRWKLPIWAEKFIQDADSKFIFGQAASFPQHITAKEALALL